MKPTGKKKKNFFFSFFCFTVKLIKTHLDLYAYIEDDKINHRPRICFVISKNITIQVDDKWGSLTLPGVPGRFRFFFAGCWEVEPLLLLSPDEFEPWKWWFCCACWCWNFSSSCWTSSSPVLPEEKLPSSPEIFDIWNWKDFRETIYQLNKIVRKLILSFCPLWSLLFKTFVSFSKIFCLVVLSVLAKRIGLFGEHKTRSLLPLEEDKKAGNSPPFLVRN